MPEDISREELKKLKREANIRAKQDEFERKRKQEEESKKDQLEELKRAFDNEEKDKVDRKLRFLKQQAVIRAQKVERARKLTEKREEKITKKAASWRKRADEEISEVIAKQEAEDARLEEEYEAARERKREREQAMRIKKQEEKAQWQELESMREEKNLEREAQRGLRGIYEVDKLKTEASDEMESFILNPYPVPLKQVLAGRMRPVPTVTELLAAYKDQKEELQDLIDQDVPTRALLANQTLFQYVRDLQMKAEAVKITPPMPQMMDLGRMRNRSSSPKRAGGNKMRGAGSMKGTV